MNRFEYLKWIGEYEREVARMAVDDLQKRVEAFLNERGWENRSGETWMKVSRPHFTDDLGKALKFEARFALYPNDRVKAEQLLDEWEAA